MRRLPAFVLSILVVAFAGPWRLAGATADVVTYAGGSGKEAFTCVLELSDRSILVGGVADDLAWVAAPAVALPATAGDGWTLPIAGGGYASQTGFILHLAADLSVKRIYRLPAGRGGAIKAIKTTSKPGDPTGGIIISGESDDGSHAWWLARLDANGVSGVPSSLAWGFDQGKQASDPVGGEGCRNAGNLRHSALWDVGGDGKVVYYAYSSTTWGCIHRLKADGSGLDVIPTWWSTGAGQVSISLKPGNGHLRSTTAADYRLVQSHRGPDPASKKKGRYPFDYYFSSHSGDPAATAGGYTGYSSDGTTANSFCVTIDRRSNDIYIGFGNGNPQNGHDFEAMLMKFDAAGVFQWYTRLKDEWLDADGDGVVDPGETWQSAPDQYADEVAIDYGKDLAQAEVLVLTRSHGNAVRNFWGGAALGGSSFHNGFTGTNGNEHLSWLGRFKGADSTFVDATWVAEYDPWSGNFGTPYADPNLDGWPDHNAGWAGLKSTWGHGLVVDLAGRAHLYGTSRGPLTTANAWQRMPIPNAGHSNGYGPWSDFVRVHTADFASLVYSSALSDPFDPTTGNGGGAIAIQGICPTANGLLVVGRQDLKGGIGSGALAVQNAPAWGGGYRNPSTTISAPDGVFARLQFSSVALPPNVPTALTATAASSSRITLSWTDAAADESGFRVQLSSDGVGWSDALTTAANATTGAIDGLQAATRYLVRLCASNGAGDSPWTAAVEVTTAPAGGTATPAPAPVAAPLAAAASPGIAPGGSGGGGGCGLGGAVALCALALGLRRRRR